MTQTQIQGKWQLMGGESAGKTFAVEFIAQVQLVFTADQMTTHTGDREFSYGYKLLPQATPSAIDVDMDGTVGKGIYSLENDRLTIAHSAAGEPRPAKFAAGTGMQITILELQRIKN